MWPRSRPASWPGNTASIKSRGSSWPLNCAPWPEKNIASCRLPAGQTLNHGHLPDGRHGFLRAKRMTTCFSCSVRSPGRFFSQFWTNWWNGQPAWGRPVIIIYSERMMHDDSYAKAFSGKPRVSQSARDGNVWAGIFHLRMRNALRKDGRRPSFEIRPGLRLGSFANIFRLVIPPHRPAFGIGRVVLSSLPLGEKPGHPAP